MNQRVGAGEKRGELASGSLIGGRTATLRYCSRDDLELLPLSSVADEHQADGQLAPALASGAKDHVPALLGREATDAEEKKAIGSRGRAPTRAVLRKLRGSQRRREHACFDAHADRFRSLRRRRRQGGRQVACSRRRPCRTSGQVRADASRNDRTNGRSRRSGQSRRANGTRRPRADPHASPASASPHPAIGPPSSRSTRARKPRHGPAARSRVSHEAGARRRNSGSGGRPEASAKGSSQGLLPDRARITSWVCPGAMTTTSWPKRAAARSFAST